MERTPVMKRSGSTSPIYHKSSSYLRDKDASFSSYLKPNHEPINFADQENQNPSPKIDESTEISIFDAQKYFNESTIIDSQKVTTITTTNSCKVSPLNNIAITNDVIEESISSQFGLSGIPRFSSASSSIDGYSNINNRNQRASSFHTANTPTASSEASWNSQTGLLSNPPGFIPVSVQNTGESRTNKDSSLSFSRAKWFSFRKKCPCPCTGKKSVQVKEKSIQRTKTSTTNQHSTSVSATEDSGTFQNETPRASLNLKGQNPSKLTKSSSTVEMSQTRIQDKERASYKSTVLKAQEFRTDCSQRNQSLSQVSKETEQSKLQVQVLDQFLSAKGRAIFNDGLRSTTNTTGFTFPILNREETNTGKSLSSSTSFSAKVALSSSSSSAIIDQPRDSLEVFEPTHESKSTDNSNRISNESIKDQSHQSNFTFKTTSPKSMVMVNNDIDDVASDASSDLFEIESFSTNQTITTTTNPNPTSYPSMFLYHNSQCRHSLDDTYSNSSFQRRFGTNGEMDLYSRRSLDEPMTLSTEYCYEPSEASIDWSVTTAEGFDRSSCVSIDHFVTDDQLISEKNKVKRISSGNNIGLLMSCRSEKAISVGPKPVKVFHNTTSSTGGGGELGQKRDPIVGEESTSSSTLGMWVVGQPNVNKPPLPRSHSARLSLPFTRS